LENRGGKKDKVSEQMWKTVETKAREGGVAKAEERREKRRSGKEIREEKKKQKKKTKEETIEVKGVVEEWEIWDEDEEMAKMLIPKRLDKWIHIFSKKASKQILTRKLWDYTIDIKKEFVPRKRKVYSLSREEREEVCKFILEQLRKEYIKISKSPLTAPVFLVGKKDGKK